MPIEVRSKFDPYTEWAAVNYDLEDKGNKLMLLSYICFILSIVFAICTLVKYKAATGENQVE